jgi:small-conductance mechanosensitive channel
MPQDPSTVQPETPAQVQTQPSLPLLDSPNLEPWLWLAGSLTVAVVLGLIAHIILFHILRRIAKHSGSPQADPHAPADQPAPAKRPLLESFIHRLIGPSRLAFPILGTQFVLATADATLASPLLTAASRFNTLSLILTITWAAVRALGFLEDLIRGRRRLIDNEFDNNIEARRLHTQVTVLARTAAILLWIVGLAIALMTFPQVRQVGTSLLASAGILGIITGIAARPIAENLLAGIQIAFTEPIRLDDVVVIENQQGTIEEITPTYIVMKCWDDRRLIVPLAYFITRPIENWTRTSAKILASATLSAKYNLPMDLLRDKLKQILEASPHWDKRFWRLDITDGKGNLIELRAVMSAANSTTAFDLKTQVREQLIEFLQRDHPEALP